MKPTDRWRQLLDERLREAVAVLGRIPGVQGFIVGGSVGRGEPWPMSDIDLLPIYAESMEPADEPDRRRAELVEWWAASGRAQTLDLGRLAFTADEIRETMAAGAQRAAERMTDQRWFHGLDKAYGGHAALAGADAPTAASRARLAPSWLQERIELCYAARIAIGEQVSPAENARDQLAAFTVHVARHRPDLHGPWTGSPEPHLGAHLAELSDLIIQIG